MISFETAVKLAKIEAEQAERVKVNASRRDAIACGSLRTNMAKAEAMEAYWARVLPALTRMADDEDADDSTVLTAIDCAIDNAPKQ